MRYDSGAHNENLSSSASSFQLSPPLKRLFNACLPTAKCRAAFPRDDWAGSLWIFPRSNYVSPRTYGFIFLARLQHSSTDPTTQISDGRSDISSRWDKPSQKSEQSQKRRMLLSRFVPFSLRGSFCLYSSECTSWTMEILNSSGVCNVFILKLIPLSMLSDDADFKSKNV